MNARAYGILAFVVGSAVPSLLLSLLLLLQHPQRPDRMGDMVLAAWLAAVGTLALAVGFGIPVALSQRFAALRPRHAALIGGALGLVSPIARLFLPALYSGVLLPLFRTHGWLAAALYGVMPGIALGLVAVLVARFVRPAPGPS